MSRQDIQAKDAQEQRIEHWISQLEAQAQLLLSDIDIEEINHKERLNLALKMMSQIQHFLVIQQKTNVSVPSAGNSVNAMLDNLMRQMRGEDQVPAPVIPIAFDEDEVVDASDALDADSDMDEELAGW
jgi:predicted alpha/beta hydrolase family esterase